MSTSVIDSQLLHPNEGDAGGTSSSYNIREECLVDLPPMTFQSGKRADDFSDSDSFEIECDGRDKPLPARPSSSSPEMLMPQDSSTDTGRSSPSSSYISDYSPSTAASSSVPVTPITPNSPFVSTSLGSSSAPSLSRASSLSGTVSQLTSVPGTRSRQPSMVALAAGFHLPTVVSGKVSPTVGHKSSLPLLNDTGNDIDTGEYFRNFGEETNASSQPAPSTVSQSSFGSGADIVQASLPVDSVSGGVMRRYASAGNLLSESSSRSGSPLGHQHSYSHPLPLPFPSVPQSPYSSSSSSPISGSSSSMTTPTASSTQARSAGSPIESRGRSRAGSTVLRNAVYIEAWNSSDFERKLLDLSSSGGSSTSSEPGAAEDNFISDADEDLQQSKWSPASSVVDLRSPGSRSAGDSSSNFGWGFPKPPKIQSPPPTPNAVSKTLTISNAGSSIGLSDAATPVSPITEDKPKRKSLINAYKRKSLTSARADPLKSQDENSPLSPPTPGKRKRLASFIAKISGSGVSQVPPVPPSPVSLSPPASVSHSPTQPKPSPHRPAPLDLSSDRNGSSASFPVVEFGPVVGAPHPSSLPHRTETFSCHSGSESETDTETEDEMDPDLIAVAAGFDLPSSQTTPKPTSFFERGRATPTADDQTSRGSYAQVYGFRSPKAPYIASAGTYRPASHSFAHLPSTQTEASVPRGATPTISATQSLIGPGDLPPSSSQMSTSQSLISPGDFPPSRMDPKTFRERRTSTVDAKSRSQSPPSPPTSGSPFPSIPESPSLVSPGKSSKRRSARMPGLIARFTLGSSASLAGSPQPSASVTSLPPLPPLKVDELGQVVADPFAKDDTTTTITPVFDNTSAAMSTNTDKIVVKRERSGTTATSASTLTSSTADSEVPAASSEHPSPSPSSKKNRRSLGLTLGGLTIGSFGNSGARSPKGNRRKLVISGIDKETTGADQAVKRWCEAFGEVRKFERRNNGDLVVDWRSKSVGHMVCRIQANVFIKGAGSVTLSWYQ